MLHESRATRTLTGRALVSKKSIDEQIRTRIDLFVEELSALVREAAIEAVEDALQGGSAATPGRRTKRKQGPRRKAGGKSVGQKAATKRVRRTADDLTVIGSKVLTYVRNKPGARMEEIAKGLRSETKDLRRSVQDLIAAKKLRTKGQKRGTTYYAGSSTPQRKSRKAKKTTTRRVGKKAA
jgi:hypothetical protein